MDSVKTRPRLESIFVRQLLYVGWRRSTTASQSRDVITDDVMAGDPVLPVRRRKSRRLDDDVTVTMATDKCQPMAEKHAHSDNEQQQQQHYECVRDTTTSLSTSLGHLPSMTSQHVSMTSDDTRESRQCATTTTTTVLYSAPLDVTRRRHQHATTDSATRHGDVTRSSTAGTHHHHHHHQEEEEEEEFEYEADTLSSSLSDSYESVDYNDNIQQQSRNKQQVRLPSLILALSLSNEVTGRLLYLLHASLYKTVRTHVYISA